MTKAFSDTQRLAIRDALMAKGRALFIQQGLTGMSLAQMTQAAGVAKTSFYLFFDSKEEMVLDLLAAEAAPFGAKVTVALTDPSRSAGDALRSFLHAMLAEYQTNPFLARLIAEPQTLAAIASRARAEDMLHKTQWMQQPLSAFLANRIALGELAPRPIPDLIDVLQSVALLVLHRDRFAAPDRFATLCSTLIDLIVDGLTRKDS